MPIIPSRLPAGPGIPAWPARLESLAPRIGPDTEIRALEVSALVLDCVAAMELILLQDARDLP